MIKESVDTSKQPLPAPAAGARLLQPPAPIAQSEQNWPLLTVSRGFFDSAVIAGRRAEGPSTSAVDMVAKVMAGLLKTMTLNCRLIWRQAYQRLLQQAERRMATLQRLPGGPLHLSSGQTTPHFLWTMCWLEIWSLHVGSFMTRLVLLSLVHTKTTSYPHYLGLPPVCLDSPRHPPSLTTLSPTGGMPPPKPPSLTTLSPTGGMP